jgi:hypothetical protein
MAKSPETQWIPSGSVLAVAIGAALLAAILVNVYLGYVRGKYEDGGQEFYQLVNKVKAKDKITSGNVRKILVPRLLVDALKAAKIVQATPEGTNIIIDKPAPRDMDAGELFFIPEFNRNTGGGAPQPSKGHEFVSVLVSPDSQVSGMQLQPGTYVTIRGVFYDLNNPKVVNPEPMTILDSIQMRLVDGSSEPILDKSKKPRSVQIELRPDQAKQFYMLQGMMDKSKGGFLVDVTGAPENATLEPEFHPDVIKFLSAKPRPTATTGTTGTTTPPDKTSAPDI